MLRGRQVEVVDDVCDVRDAILLRGRSTRSSESRICVGLVSHVLLLVLASRRLVEVVVAHVLHARQCVLFLVVCSDVRSARLVQAARTLESLVSGPILLRRIRPLACAMLHLLVLVPQTDHVLLFRFLHALVPVCLRCPWIYQRLLVVGGLLLTVCAFAVATSCLGLAGLVLTWHLAVSELLRGPAVLIASLVASSGLLKIRGLLLPLLGQVSAWLLARGAASLLATWRILQVGVLDLSLVGCGPLLLRLPLARVVPLLSTTLFLVQKLYLFLPLLRLLLFLQLLLQDLLLLKLELPFALLPVEYSVTHHLGPEEVDGVVAYEVLDGVSAIVDLAELNEEWDQVE